MKNNIENAIFFCFHPIVSCMVFAKKLDLALRLQDDFTVGMSLCGAAINFGFMDDPWPKSARDAQGNLAPHLGNVAVPQE